MHNTNSIALALSGGGFRATYFHLGVIKYLQKTGLIKQVTHISSVSGGSICGAHLTLNWDQYSSDDDLQFQAAADELLELASFDLRGHISRRLIASFGFRDTTQLLQKYYDRFLYKQATLSDLRSSSGGDTPELMLLATNLTRGCPIGFTTDGLVMDARNCQDVLLSPSTPVSLAVAASSAYPALFKPMRISAEDLNLSIQDFNPGVQYLTDGGVFDNTGALVLAEMVKHSNVDLFIVSDAGSVLDWQDRHYGLLGGLVRTYEVTMDTAAQHQSKLIMNGLDTTKVHINITDASSEHTTDWMLTDCKLISQIRTDLDKFGGTELRSLLRHGYELAAQNLAQFPGAVTGNGYEGISAKYSEFDLNKKKRQLLKKAGDTRLRLLSLQDPIILLPGLLILVAFLISTINLGFTLYQDWKLMQGQNLDLHQVTTNIAGPKQDKDTLLFKRGVMNNILSMAFEPMPITGQRATTNSINIAEHSTVFIQGEKQLIKLQRFNLPRGAKQIRAQSRQTVEATGEIANVWTWIEYQDGRIQKLDRSFSDHWRIAEDKDFAYFYVFALYDNGLFTQPSEFSGAEINDLAGEIEVVRFGLGGKIQDLSFGEVLHFSEESPLQFFSRDLENIKTVTAPYPWVQDRFTKLIDAARDTAKKSRQGRLQQAIAVWDEVAAGEDQISWAAIELRNVHRDFIMRLDGKRISTNGRKTN